MFTNAPACRPDTDLQHEAVDGFAKHETCEGDADHDKEKRATALIAFARAEPNDRSTRLTDKSRYAAADLVEELGGERDAELGGDDRHAALAESIDCVELCDRRLPRLIVGSLVNLDGKGLSFSRVTCQLRHLGRRSSTGAFAFLLTSMPVRAAANFRKETGMAGRD